MTHDIASGVMRLIWAGLWRSASWFSPSSALPSGTTTQSRSRRFRPRRHNNLRVTHPPVVAVGHQCTPVRKGGVEVATRLGDQHANPDLKATLSGGARRCDAPGDQLDEAFGLIRDALVPSHHCAENCQKNTREVSPNISCNFGSQIGNSARGKEGLIKLCGRAVLGVPPPLPRSIDGAPALECDHSCRG